MCPQHAPGCQVGASSSLGVWERGSLLPAQVCVTRVEGSFPAPRDAPPASHGGGKGHPRGLLSVASHSCPSGGLVSCPPVARDTFSVLGAEDPEVVQSRSLRIRHKTSWGGRICPGLSRPPPNVWPGKPRISPLPAPPTRGSAQVPGRGHRRVGGACPLLDLGPPRPPLEPGEGGCASRYILGEGWGGGHASLIRHAPFPPGWRCGQYSPVCGP